jgi:tetratricopeptide (TPR) repeat protein
VSTDVREAAGTTQKIAVALGITLGSLADRRNLRHGRAMTKDDLTRLAEDLEAGRLEAGTAQKLAAKALPENPWLQQASDLVAEAVKAYTDGKTGRARAAATVADAYLRTWTRTRLHRWTLSGGGNDALDCRARALAVLTYIEADAGREESAAELRRASDQVLARMRDSTPARFAISATTAERALRQGRADEAIVMMEAALQLPALDESRRAAAQVLLALSLQKAGRVAEGIATLEASKQSFLRAGWPTAALEADEERAVHLLQAGDKVAARSLLTQVATAAAAGGQVALEANARLRLGLLSSELGEHAESARQFQLGAAAARREGDDSKIVGALRNAANEMRRQDDFAGAERLLSEAFAIKTTTRAVVLELAKAKYVFAFMRAQQQRLDEARHFLDDAESTFQLRLDELEPLENPPLRVELEGKLRQVAALREQMSR